MHERVSSFQRRLLLAAMLTLAMGAAWVAPANAGEATEKLPLADARAWLLRIHNAASQRNYQGTLVTSAGGQISSSRVAHYADGTQSYERVEMLDGQARQVLRHNDRVVTLWPTSKLAQVEQRDVVALFPAVLTGSDDQLFERYEMRAEGSARLAGLDATVFLLKPRDAWRFAQRLWAAQDSGLLLRADVLAADGRIIESSAFTDVTIGVKAQPDSVLLPMKRLDGYKVAHAALQRTALEAEGWRLQAPVPGFRQLSCVKRSFDASPADVLQTIFSDGLTHVSVFVEPLQPERQRAGHAALGATHTLTMPLGTAWITVMGDVPLVTLKQFITALERTK